MTRQAKLTLLLILICAPTIAPQNYPQGSQRSPHAKNDSTPQFRIPSADPAKFSGVMDAKDWKNPYIVVCADGVLILGITPVDQLTPVESVPKILAQLPSSAWPYGLIVALQDVGLQGIGEGPRISVNREKLLKLLKRFGVPVKRWPSA
jgi:hypothetical protein